MKSYIFILNVLEMPVKVTRRYQFTLSHPTGLTLEVLCLVELVHDDLESFGHLLGLHLGGVDGLLELQTTGGEVLVEADKTRNFYNLDKESYNNLLEKEIHKDYKKAAEKDSKTAESWLS